MYYCIMYKLLLNANMILFLLNSFKAELSPTKLRLVILSIFDTNFENHSVSVSCSTLILADLGAACFGFFYASYNARCT